MSYTCSAQEVYDNKLELAKFLQQMEVCPDCEPPPLNNSYTVRYQVSSADAVPWAQVPVGTWTTEYAHDPCSVPGITCDRCGAAITVALGFPNAAPITGRLTSSMPNLPLIESFFIASTLPTPEDAEMPQDVANFPRLQQLFFGGVVKGNLPDLSQAPMISAVRFVNTEMTGNPNNFFGAPTMLSINVDQSGLASNAGFDWTPMSDKICQTARITEFRMASVNLYGPVPSCFAKLTALNLIKFSRNLLSGPIASLFGSAAVTEMLLDGNKFTGTIPTFIQNMTSLKTLLAPDQSIRGTLPSLAGLTALSQLDLSNNYLTGAGEIEGSLLVASFANNSFTDLPITWLTLPGVRSLDLSDNRLTYWPPAGVYQRGILDEFGTLSTCGMPPKFEFFDWPDMETVSISRNPLNGQDVRDVMGSFAPLPRLRTLEVEGCGLEMDLPEEGLNQMLVQVDAFGCDPGLSSGFSGLVSLRAGKNNIRALWGGPWSSIQQADFSDNNMTYVNPLWFGGDVLFQDYRQNDFLEMDVVPATETALGCDSPDLVGDPAGYRAWNQAADSVECTSVCTGSFIIYVESTVNTTSLCRCQAGYYGKGANCSASPIDTWSSVGMAEPVPCPTNSSTDMADKQVQQEDCLCIPGYYSAYDRSTMYCEPCPENTFVITQGAKDVSVCTSCEQGRRSRPGSTVCEDCELGAIAAGGAGEGCQSCPPGQFAAVQGATECSSCAGGQYQPQAGQVGCIACPGENMDTWLQEREASWPYLYKSMVGAQGLENCGCASGFRDIDGVCESCGSGQSEGLACPGGLGPEVITLDKGFYSDWPISVFRCWGGEDRCPGNRLPGAACDFDRIGITCALCRDGKVLTDQGDCVECGGFSTVLLLLGIGLLIFGCVALYYSLDKKESVRTPNSTRLAVLTVAVLLTFVQQLGVLSTMPVDWRAPLDIILQSSRNMNFNPSIFRVGCSFPDSDPLIDFVVRMLIPFSIVLFLGVVHVIFLTFRLGVRRQGRVWTNYSRSAGLVAAIFYISIVSLIISPYQCQEHPNGKWTSQDYKSLICWEGGDHTVMIIISTVSILAPAAFAALVLWAVWVYPKKVLIADKNFVRGYEFMFDRYKPQAYWDIVKHIIRSLLLACTPILPTALVVAFVMIIVQVVCALMTAHHMPFRIYVVNYLEVILNSGTIVFICASIVFIPNGEAENDLAVRWIVAVLFLCVMWAPILLLKAIYEKMVALRRFCAFFICHHQRATGCFAALLRMSLQGHLPAGRVVWLDSDRLRSSDAMLNRVREHTDTLVVLGSREIFLRTWCVAEMAVAEQMKVPICLIKLPDYEMPLDVFIERYDQLVHIGPLVELGMTDMMIKDTLRSVSTSAGLQMPLDVDNKIMESLTELMLTRSFEGLVPAEHDDFTQTELIICPDYGNVEGVSTAMVLVRMLPLTENGSHPQIFPPHEDLYGRERAVLVFSPGCLESESFIAAICKVAYCNLQSVPVVTDEGFHIPGHKEVELRLSHWDFVASHAMDGRKAKEYLNNLLKELSVLFTVVHDTEVNLMKIAMRIYLRAFETDSRKSHVFARPSDISVDSELSVKPRQLTPDNASRGEGSEGPMFPLRSNKSAGSMSNNYKSSGSRRTQGASIRTVLSGPNNHPAPSNLPSMHINSETEPGSHKAHLADSVTSV